MAIPRKEREKEATFAAIMLENFPRINVRHQTKDPGSSENTKQDICKQTNKKPKTNKQKTARKKQRKILILALVIIS